MARLMHVINRGIVAAIYLACFVSAVSAQDHADARHLLISKFHLAEKDVVEVQSKSANLPTKGITIIYGLSPVRKKADRLCLRDKWWIAVQNKGNTKIVDSGHDKQVTISQNNTCDLNGSMTFDTRDDVDIAMLSVLVEALSKLPACAARTRWCEFPIAAGPWRLLDQISELKEPLIIQLIEKDFPTPQERNLFQATFSNMIGESHLVASISIHQNAVQHLEVLLQGP